MKILFVKLKHIGDALLVTPTLTAVKAQYPDAEIWVVVRRGTESVLAGCPSIDRLLTSVAPEQTKRAISDWASELKLIRTLRQQHFDYAFELSDGDRGRFLTVLSGAKVRALNDVSGRLKNIWRPFFQSISRFDWRKSHSVEKDFYTVHDALPLELPIPPLAFVRPATAGWEPADRLGEFVVLHPASRWLRNRWPLEKWITVGRWLLERVPHLVISAGPHPDEIKLAQEIQIALGARAVSTEGKLSWAQLAGVLYRARLMVVGDTGALHLGAACQCPIVGLYRPGMVVHWSPWQTRYRAVYDPAYAPKGGRHPQDEASSQTVAPILEADVLTACAELLEDRNVLV